MTATVAPPAAVTTLPAGLPSRTLGWAVLEWCSTRLRQPDGPDAGAPFRFTAEQARFVLWWYAIDEQGRFLSIRGVLRRAKGWGKSPFVAALALAELCGPVRFGGWDDDGDPIAVPAAAAWVQIAGVSEKQTDNTMTVVLAMLEGSDAVDEYGLDVGLTRVFSAAGGRLEPITASAKTAEGARPTFVVLDETHHWTRTNGGHGLAQVIRRNLGKSRGGAARSLETTNAHEPGLDSTAERSYEAWQAQREGRARGSGLLYDSREAPAGIDLADEAALRRGLEAAYGDSTWVDLDRIVAEVYDPDTSPDLARRFYLNQIIASADAWLSPDEWDACADPALALRKRDTIALAFDGSRNEDSTALAACRIEDGAVFLLACWEKPEVPELAATWEVPREQVDDEVAHAFGTYDVVAFYADLREFESYVDRWRDLYGDDLEVKATTGDGKRGHAVAWDMRGRVAEFTAAVERAEIDVRAGDLRHDGNPVLRRHVANARRRPNRYGVSIGKETRDSPRKVDAAVTAVLARLARADVLNAGAHKRRRKRSGRLVGF